jgi:hypothetical protein
MCEDEVLVGLVARGLEVQLELAGDVVGQRDAADERFDLGVPNLPRTKLRRTRTRTRTRCAVQSTSIRRSASSSPWRVPVIAAVMYITRSTSLSASAGPVSSRSRP